jgi:sortase B
MPEFDVRPAYGRRRRKSKGFLPRKGEGTAESVRKIVFLVSVPIFAAAIVILLDYYVFDVFGFFKNIPPDSGDPSNFTAVDIDRDDDSTGILELLVDPNCDSGDTVEIEILERYRELYEMNNDFVGYLAFGTHINYPVVWRQHDNSFYLNRNFERRSSELGTVFADGWGTFSYPDPATGSTGRPDNIVLHGHYARTGAVFNPLREFIRNDTGFTFLQENPTVHFDTLFEQGTYKIFAVAQVNVNENLGDVFPFWQRSHFDTDDEFYEYVVEIMDRSRFHTDVDLRPGDELLTLSTCDQTMFSSSVRIVIVARRLRPDESISTEREFVNLTVPNSRGSRGRDERGFMRYMMFHDFYKINNNNRGWVGRHTRYWDTSRVEGLDEFLARNPRFMDWE